MATTPPNCAVDDGLDLEKVAVGAYCVFDSFKPPLRSNPDRPTRTAPPARTAPNKMDILSNDYPFSNGLRGPWTSSGDDITLVAPTADDYTSPGFDDWMMNFGSGPPLSAQVKPLNIQGDHCFIKEEQRPPIYSRRQDSGLDPQQISQQNSQQNLQLGNPLEGLPLSTPLQNEMTNPSFTFGGDIPHPAAFDFNPTTISPHSTEEGQTGYYSPPMWEPQDNREMGLYSQQVPQAYDQSALYSAPLPPDSTPSLEHSPGSLHGSIHNGPHTSSSSASSPEPVMSNSRSRKRNSSLDESDEAPASKKEKKNKPTQPPMKMKTAHNMIEKRYRTNLNDKIAALRNSVPSLRASMTQEDDGSEGLDGLTPAHKSNKATILSKATEYIHHLEKRNKRLQDDVTVMKSRLEGYEKMAMSGQMSNQMALHGPVRTTDNNGNRYHDNPFSHPPGMVAQSVSAPAQGMIPVPESMANLHRGHPPQPHYAQHAQQPAGYPPFNGAGRPGLPGPPIVNGRRSSGMMGKVIMGSLAGIMMLEGLVEHEQSTDETSGRGLFALPLNFASFLTPRVSIGGASAQLPIAKLLLIFGAVFYLIAPLFDFKSAPKKKTVLKCDIPSVPSLASPVELRRKAWLTAIQTVWVPGHNFFQVAAALCWKTVKLCTGQYYALFWRITKDQEAARVKAWDIAIDAQLTGGDAEISRSRLLLTLMASGTLPNTPARLMLKALHIRLLCREFACAQYGFCRIFSALIDGLSAKWARSYWNAARSEQKIAVNMASKPDSEAEPLPGHMAALLEMECDDVLVTSIIQRACNLAWNRPSAEGTTLDESMEGVVEDFAICSPLDALAAWWSCYTLKRALSACLAAKDCIPKQNATRDLELALRTAPPTSQAYLRAVVAQAVVFDKDQSGNVQAAWRASTSPSTAAKQSHTMPMNLVETTPTALDIYQALTLARCHTLAQSVGDEARHSAASFINKTLHPESTLTLLSFVAGYKVLTSFMQDAALQAESSRGLECLASSLRTWAGRESGRSSGLSNKTRGRIVGDCLRASKTLVGFSGEAEAVDDGYFSASVKDD